MLPQASAMPPQASAMPGLCHAVRRTVVATVAEYFETSPVAARVEVMSHSCRPRGPPSTWPAVHVARSPRSDGTALRRSGQRVRSLSHIGRSLRHRADEYLALRHLARRRHGAAFYVTMQRATASLQHPIT